MIERKVVEKTIGKSFADKLDTIVFDVSDTLRYTRREMVEELGCANFQAAARLQKVLKRLGITTPSQLHKTDPFSLVRSKGIGEASMFVAMCILDAFQYHVGDWWGWKETNTLKFSTFKHNAIRRANKRKQEVA